MIEAKLLKTTKGGKHVLGTMIRPLVRGRALKRAVPVDPLTKALTELEQATAEQQQATTRVATAAAVVAALAQQPPVEEPLTMSPAQVAERLGVSRGVVYDLLDAGLLASFRIGQRRVVRADAVRAYVAREGVVT